MICVLSTNITSPLGFTTEQNYQAVLSGCSALKRYEGLWGLPEAFAASLFGKEQIAALAIEGYTRFESLAIHSIREALSYISIDIASPRVVFILSTTKGNIGESPSDAAKKIAKAIGLTTTPIVVCNACVSGLSAQLLANHLLSAGLYDHAIVTGAEVQSKFIVSGFQSLKAVSEEPCRPFDIERNGLNPGEATATIIYGSPSSNLPFQWRLIDGAVRSDAYHNVSPSPQADGLTAAIKAVMEEQDKSQLATVCAHGTATLYNDQMEAVAIHRAGLADVPVSALKGYYGHTMGAAGVLEVVLTIRATDDGIILPAKGFTELGVSKELGISNEPRQTDKTSFLKLMSGFGGCNVAALYVRCTKDNIRWQAKQPLTLTKTNTIRITSSDEKSLTDIYKRQIGDYPKFYKMDILSRLAFVAAELLAPLPLHRGGENSSEVFHRGDLEEAIILFNHSSSLVTDRQFLATISDTEDFTDALAPWDADKARCFPSPSLFVYTLPNIAASEIAIRHHICGETCFYILPSKDEAIMQQILEATLRGTNGTSVISGWVDAEDEQTFECELSTYNYIPSN